MSEPQTTALLVLLYVLLIEALLYAVSLTRRGREALARLGLEVNLFTVLVKKRGRLDVLNIVRRNRALDLLITSGVFVMIGSMLVFYIGIFFIGIDYVLRIVRDFYRGVPIETSTPPIAPIVPGLTIQGEDILYLLVAIGLSIAFHEIGHAVASKIHGIEPRSYGVGLFLIMPLAFVEIDERELYRDRGTAVRVLSAGILLNMILFAVSLALIVAILSLIPYTGVVEGAVIQSVEPGLPAYNAGVRPGLLITEINGSPIYTLERFYRLRGTIASGENITLVLRGVYPNGTVLETTIYKPYNLSVIGVRFDGVYIPLANFFVGALVIPGERGYVRLWSLEALLRELVWLMIVNISLAVINAAPLYITDGGRFLSILLPKKLSSTIQLVTVVGFTAIFIASFAAFL